MKSIIMAAGYATRLYPLTENFPKPLLEIGGSTILGRLLADIDSFPEVDAHAVVTNAKFAPMFREWAAGQSLAKPLEVIDDGTRTNDTRLGAVRDLLLAIDRLGIDDDILVLAADNLLDFSLRGFVDSFLASGLSTLMCHREPDLGKLRRTGVIEVGPDMRVLRMQEKPEHPASNWAVPPFYIYSRRDLPLVKGCLEHGCGADAPGNLARYMCGATRMMAYPMPGKRLDIGSLDTYEQARQLYK